MSERHSSRLDEIVEEITWGAMNLSALRAVSSMRRRVGQGITGEYVVLHPPSQEECALVRRLVREAYDLGARVEQEIGSGSGGSS